MFAILNAAVVTDSQWVLQRKDIPKSRMELTEEIKHIEDS